MQKLNNLSKWINDLLFPPPRLKAYLSRFSSQFDLLRRLAEVKGEERKKKGEERQLTLEGLVIEQGLWAPVMANMVQRSTNKSLSVLESLSNCT